LKINNDGESKVNVIAINIGREEEKWFKKLIFLSNLRFMVCLKSFAPLFLTLKT